MTTKLTPIESAVVTLIVAAAGFLFATAALLFGPVAHAWVIVRIWGWYLTAYAPPPALGAVFGGLLVLALIRRMDWSEANLPPKEAWKRLGLGTLRPFIVLFVAWALKGWL